MNLAWPPCREGNLALLKNCHEFFYWTPNLSSNLRNKPMQVLLRLCCDLDRDGPIAPAWCTDHGWGRTDPNPVRGQATRTYFGRPSSCMRLSTWTATFISVARRSSVCARNRSPITCFHRPMAASARARFVYPDALCQALRPWSAICWRWRSRGVGALSAVSLGTAVARGGTITSASGWRSATLA